MIFDNVKVLGYSHEHKFLGENAFILSRIKTINIRGYILDLANSAGVESILIDAFKLQKECAKIQDLVINGKNFGKGRAKSFSVDSGNWVRTTEYSATFEVYENVDITQNISSKEFIDVDLTKDTLKNTLRLVKNLSESYSIDFEPQSLNLKGNHSVEIEYVSEAGTSYTDPIGLAKALAGELLDALPSNIFDGAYLYRSDYIKTSKETYDLISKRCSFDTEFSYRADGSALDYYVNRNHSITINQNGVMSVVESGEIIVETEKSTASFSLFNAVNSEIASSGSRCSSFFIIHASKMASGSSSFHALNTNKELEKSIVVNKIEQTANYSITYDNDPKRVNDKYILTRSLEMQRENNGVWSIKETGSSTGVGKRGSIDKYNNAKLGWDFVSPGIPFRIANFYTLYAKVKTGRFPQYINKNATFEIYKGVIDYSVEYSDDPKLSSAGDGAQYEIEVSDTGLSPILQDFLVPNAGYAVQQSMGLIKQGEQTVSVKLISLGNNDECLHKHSTSLSAPPIFNSMTYFNILRAKAAFQPSQAKDGYKDVYLESIDYQADEIKRTAQLTQKFKYS